MGSPVGRVYLPVRIDATQGRTHMDYESGGPAKTRFERIVTLQTLGVTQEGKPARRGQIQLKQYLGPVRRLGSRSKKTRVSPPRVFYAPKSLIFLDVQP